MQVGIGMRTVGVLALAVGIAPARDARAQGPVQELPSGATVKAELERAAFAGLLQDPASRDAAIERDIQFRTSFGLRADRAYVESLYANPDRTTRVREIALFTPEERQEVTERFAMQESMGAVDGYMLADRARSTGYAGIHREPTTGVVVVNHTVAVDPATRQSLNRLVPDAGRLRIQIVRFSLNDLASHVEAARAQVAADPTLASIITGVNVDIPTNGIDIRLSPGGQVDAILPQTLGLPPEVPLSVHVEPPFEDASLRDDRANVPALEGGNGIWVLDTGKVCTVGYELTNTLDPAAGWLVTAAHCAHNPSGYADDSKVYHGDPNLGMANLEFVGTFNAADPMTSSSDLGYVKVINDNWIGEKVHMDAGLPMKPVVGVQPAYTGQHVCFTGATSNFTQCSGVVTNPAFGGSGYTNSILVDCGGRGGDSGGPLFFIRTDGGVDVLGVHRSVTGPDADDDCNDESVFTKNSQLRWLFDVDYA